MTPAVRVRPAHGRRLRGLPTPEVPPSTRSRRPISTLDPVFDDNPRVAIGPVIKLPLMEGFVHAPTAAVVHQFLRIA